MISGDFSNSTFAFHYLQDHIRRIGLADTAIRGFGTEIPMAAAVGAVLARSRGTSTLPAEVQLD